jgi:hypothetical protein
MQLRQSVDKLVIEESWGQICGCRFPFQGEAVPKGLKGYLQLNDSLEKGPLQSASQPASPQVGKRNEALSAALRASIKRSSLTPHSPPLNHNHPKTNPKAMLPQGRRGGRA